jgi:hypothetical protein
VPTTYAREAIDGADNKKGIMVMKGREQDMMI